jgi:hypothetical protein
MRIFLLFAFVWIGIASASADTLDYYHVYYRGQKIAQFTEGKRIEITLKADSITPFDSIRVKVFRDAPCGSGCTYSLLIFDNKAPLMVDTAQHTADFVFALAPLVTSYRKTGTRVFNGYYTEFIPGVKTNRVISFAIKLE